MMHMTFEASSRVTLLFAFWDVHEPAGMVLSVFVVFLLTLFYELLKVWRLWLGHRAKGTWPQDTSVGSPSKYSSPQCHRLSSAGLDPSPSESSLAPIEPSSSSPSTKNSVLLHCIQTALHVLQVSLGYILMLCVMSYNIWIFLGVILGSATGYFVAFPLLSQQI